METPVAKKTKKARKNKRRSSISSDGGLFEDSGNAEVPPNSASAESDILGNSLSGMSKDEMRKHYELCMRLAAENKITLKNSFGLHLIGIMKQMVSESTDLQLASLSLAASSKIYSGRVEALYKDTVQFHTSLQTMFTTGKKNKKDEMETNEDDEEESERRKSKYNKYKSYLTNAETISIDSFGNNSLMPHPNFVVINSAFSANRSAIKLVSMPLESDSNKLGFPCSSCFAPEKAPASEDQGEPVPDEVFTAPKIFKVQLEKVLHMKPQTFEDMEAANASMMYQPPPPSSPFEAPSNDDLSVFSAEPNGDFGDLNGNGGDMDGVIDRFSILNITVDAFTNAISKAVTSDCSLDVSKLPEDSALRSVLKKPLLVKSTTKQKREPKVKEPFFNGEPPAVQKTYFMEGKKSSTQATYSDWSIRDTSIFFETDAYQLNLPEDSESSVAEICSFPFWYFSNRKEVDVPFFIKPMEPYKHPWNSFGNDAQDKNRRSSFGRCLAGKSVMSDLVPEDLAQSFQELNLNDDCGAGVDDPGSPAPPLEEMNLSGGAADPSEWRAASLLEEGQESLSMPDVQNIMVQPPQVVKHLNMRHEMVQNNLNMEKGKDIVWSLISSHLDKKESVLMSEIHQELGSVVKSLSSSNQLYSLGNCVQFTFVILLILANEKTLLLKNLEKDNDIIIKKDVREVEAVTGVLA